MGPGVHWHFRGDGFARANPKYGGGRGIRLAIDQHYVVLTTTLEHHTYRCWTCMHDSNCARIGMCVHINMLVEGWHAAFVVDRLELFGHACVQLRAWLWTSSDLMTGCCGYMTLHHLYDDRWLVGRSCVPC